MSQIFTLAFLFSSLRLATPLLLAALGGLYSERSGVINIALEALLLAGAFTAATVTHFSGNPWLGLFAAIIAGVGVALVHGVACIRFRADQVVSGTALNIVFLGLPQLLAGAFFASTGATPQLPKGQLLPLAPMWIAFLLVPVTWYVLERTRFGLRVRAVGEHPDAAESVGVSVKRVRYAAVALSGMLAALGGVYLALDQHQFTDQMTAGRGFIAISAVIFGRWDPIRAAAACLLFAAAETLQIQLQGNHAIASQFIETIPYVLTIIALAGVVGRAVPPAALGKVED